MMQSDSAKTRLLRSITSTGFDVDVIGGYDFGMFRVEGELGYKRACIDDC